MWNNSLFTDRSSWVCGKYVWKHAAVPTTGLSHWRSASFWVQARSKVSFLRVTFRQRGGVQSAEIHLRTVEM